MNPLISAASVIAAGSCFYIAESSFSGSCKINLDRLQMRYSILTLRNKRNKKTLCMKYYFDHSKFLGQNFPDLNDRCPLAKAVDNTVKIAKLNCETSQKECIYFAYRQGVDAAKMVRICLLTNKIQLSLCGVTSQKMHILKELIIIHETSHLLCWQPIEETVWVLNSLKRPVSLVIDRQTGEYVIFWNKLESIILHKHQAILDLLYKLEIDKDLIIKETQIVKKETDYSLLKQPMVCLTCSQSEDPDLRVKLTQAFHRGFERAFFNLLVSLYLEY